MILASDIKVYYSGGAANSNPALSIGGDFSNVEIPDAIENLFPSLRDAELTTGITQYRCVYVFNTNLSDTVYNLQTYFNSQLNTPNQLSIGINLANDTQRLTITGDITGGSIVLTYTDALAVDYDTQEIEYGSSLSDFAQNIQNKINLLDPIFGDVVCNSIDTPSYKYIDISFTGLDGNKIHNLLSVKTNNLTGIGIPVLNFSKIVDGSPINTEAQLLTNDEIGPVDISYTENLNKISVGTLRTGEGFPVWIKRVITTTTDPAVLAGGQLNFSMIRTQFPSTPKPTIPPTPTPNPTASPCPTATPNILFMKGANNYGQIGNNTTIYATDFTAPVGNAVNYSKVSCGFGTVLAIKTDGTLWGFGANSRGELGDNTIIKKSSPVQTIAFGTNWSDVSIRYINAVGVKTDNTLWTWGANNFGELGINVYVSGVSSPIQTVAYGTDWSQASAGNGFASAVKKDGTLWSWGHNIKGQLGTNSITAPGFGISSPVQTCTFATDWSFVATGSEHSAAIKTDGSLWCWGGNSFGQLGCNDTNDKSSPVQTIAYGTNWTKIACGNAHTVGVKKDGTMWSWGYNYTGCLGDNTSINKSSPVQVYGYSTDWLLASASQNTIGLKTNGELWEFGSYNVSSPVQIASCGYSWKSVSLGSSFFGAISQNLPTPSPTLTPSPTPTPSSTEPTPTPTSSPSPSASPSPTPSPTPSSSPTPTPSATEPTPTPTPTEPTPTPTASPTPTLIFTGLGVLYVAWE